ncbi:MAG: hypothetical protein CSA18_05095 [Deltaproteobacteria bacterium]|nr:MAG: hypothetical protein CSA18_05095 [Deltaproteobacteria bacterium]
MAQRVMPTNYLSDVIRPLFFVGNKEKNLGEIQRNFQLLFKTVFLFACPLFVAFLLLSREVIVVIFNGEFIDYYLILIAVACSNFLNTFSVPVGLVAQLKEKADIIFYSKIFAVYNLLADIALIPFLGIWGAVLATGTALLGKNLYIWFHVRDAAPFSGMSEFFIKMFVYWSFVAYLWLFARQFIGGDTLRLGFGIIYIAMGCYFQLRTISFSQWEWDLLHSLSAGNKKVGILLKWSGLLHNNNRK